MEALGYGQLWKSVIRPPRQEYHIMDLGPMKFTMNHKKFVRQDLELKSHKGLTLQCSHYEPAEEDREWEELPCVIYLHGNSSARLEAVELAPYILTSNMSLFCFDFAGCGLSEGEYISLGWYEREDVQVIIEHLRSKRRVSTIGLWGRSMGAVTALLYADRDPSIAAIILDSPFADLKILINELAKQYSKVPSILVSGATKLIRKTIKSKANFDIYNLAPINHVEKSFIPALFAAANQDDFIQPHHCQDLYKKYAGDKNITQFDGDHNSPRPEFFLDSAVIFLYSRMQCEVLLTEESKRPKKEKVVGIVEPEDDQNFLQSIAAARLNGFPMPMSEFQSQVNQNFMVNDGEDFDDQILQQVLAQSMKDYESTMANSENQEEQKINDEEKYLIECMQNINVSGGNQGGSTNQSTSLNGDNNQPSIDDLLK